MQNLDKKTLKNVVTIAFLLCIVVVFIFFIVKEPIKPNISTDKPISSIISQTEISSHNEVSNTLSSHNTEEKTEILPEMLDLYTKNPDTFAWIKIENTNIDYPVMFTPDNEEKYLYADFNGNYNAEGTPFIDKDCSSDPESTNLIIYGHNMLAGTMFENLLNYEDENYWKEHPTIKFKTLYEDRTYEIIGAFRDRVYYKYENCFKFYQFIDPKTEEEFNEAISYYIQNTPYDMNVNAKYGDKLITLVTCAYHHQYGRYVVVAREIKE